MDPNHDIVPTLRMFDGLIMNKAADEIERLRALLMKTPNPALPPLGDGPRREITVTVSVPADWQHRLDMQWVLEREIHADRWRWNWPSVAGEPMDQLEIEELFDAAAGADEETHVRFARLVEQHHGIGKNVTPNI